MLDFIRDRELLPKEKLPPSHLLGDSLSKESLKALIVQADPSLAKWHKLQAFLYTVGIAQAQLFEGFEGFLKNLNRLPNVEIYIVSQKGETLDFKDDEFEEINLRRSARDWLKRLGVVSGEKFKAVHFLDSRRAKLAKVQELALDLFIDDLPEVLEHEDFPEETVGALFDPLADGQSTGKNWRQIEQTWLPQLSDYSRFLDRQVVINFPVSLKSFIQVRGGQNNRCYKVSGSSEYFVKFFASVDHLNRERFKSELQFRRHFGVLLQHRLLPVEQTDELYRFQISPWVNGKGSTFDDQNVDRQKDLSQCLEFIEEAWRNRPSVAEIAKFDWASEAHQSYGQSLKNILQRLALLETTRINGSDFHLDVRDTVRGVAQTIEAQTDIDVEFPISELMLSPSDFGFHNSIRANGRLYFFDFEYAGIDHPAKLISDFILRPEHKFTPSEVEQILRFSETLFGEWFPDRLRLGMPLFACKWIFTFLNEFIPESYVRRKQALGLSEFEMEKRLELQLSKAQAMLLTAKELVRKITTL